MVIGGTKGYFSSTRAMRRLEKGLDEKVLSRGNIEGGGVV
jgi:hypothetical protein